MTLSAGYSANNAQLATPYVLIPVEKGTHSVYIECEGDYAVKTIGGKADGCWNGIIAFDARRDGWMAREYAGVKMSNYKASCDFVCGHPDVVLNDCKFAASRGVECDFICSFHLEVEDDGYFALQAPPIMKDSDFNYAVSYANYTEKLMEWGAINIQIDEVNPDSTYKSRRTMSKKGTRLFDTLKPLPLDLTTCIYPDWKIGLPQHIDSEADVDNSQALTIQEITPVENIPDAEPMEEYGWWNEPKLLQGTEPARRGTQSELESEAGKILDSHHLPPKAMSEIRGQLAAKGYSRLGSAKSLLGGTLRQNIDPIMYKLTADETRQHKLIERTQGKTKAKEYLDSLRTKYNNFY